MNGFEEYIYTTIAEGRRVCRLKEQLLHRITHADRMLAVRCVQGFGHQLGPQLLNGGLRKLGTPVLDPQIAGSPLKKGPNQVPLISGSPQI